MALTKVGDSAGQAVFNTTPTETFTADTSFAEDDMLFTVVRLLTDDAGTHFPGLGQGPSAPQGNGVDGWPWVVVYHAITAGEAGAATYDMVFGDNIRGFVLPGIAIRGSDGTLADFHGFLDYATVPLDNYGAYGAEGDVAEDFTGGPSPQSAPLLVHPSVSTEAALVLYAASADLETGFTGTSTWGAGATQLGSDLQGAVYPAGTHQWGFASGAYALIAANEDEPAQECSLAYTGGTTTLSLWRAVVVLTPAPLPTPTESTRYELVSRRINARDLPHSVSARMFEQELES